MPLVTVVIPCYNHAHYLPDALNSVLAQTFTDWEAIVVDDGSTDNTREAAQRFTDPRIRYIYQENQGLSAARNTGIEHALGQFLAFLDADDEWEPTFLAQCLSVLQQDKSLGFVYARTFFIDPQGHKLPQLGGQAVAGERFRERILMGGFFPVHAAIVRRSALENVGRFDTALTSVEDWDMWLRVSAQYPVQSIDKPLARYRVYPGSMSTNAERMHQNRMVVLARLFGSDEGDPIEWGKEKRRAYGFAYRRAALGYIMQGEVDAGWQHLAQSVAIYPDLLNRLDTFYELILDNQPKGERGQAHLLDIETNGMNILYRLGRLFDEAGPELSGKRDLAFGNAYLALGMLSDQAGDWSQARQYLRQAIQHNPRLLSLSFARRFVKLLLGKRLTIQIKKLSGSTPPKPQGGSETVGGHCT